MKNPWSDSDAIALAAIVRTCVRLQSWRPRLRVYVCMWDVWMYGWVDICMRSGSLFSV